MAMALLEAVNECNYIDVQVYQIICKYQKKHSNHREKKQQKTTCEVTLLLFLLI